MPPVFITLFKRDKSTLNQPTLSAIFRYCDSSRKFIISFKAIEFTRRSLTTFLDLVCFFQVSELLFRSLQYTRSICLTAKGRKAIIKQKHCEEKMEYAVTFLYSSLRSQLFSSTIADSIFLYLVTLFSL